MLEKERLEMSTKEMLDVRFGGAFSTNEEYTNPTGEIKDGRFLRRSENVQIMEGRIILDGNDDGVDFIPRNSLGSNIIDQALVIEVEFRATQHPQPLDTIVSVGGNMYVRYESPSSLEYGFTVNNQGNLDTYKQTASAPEVGKDYSIVMIYEPTADGANMKLIVGGIEQSPVISKNGQANIIGENMIVSFGNEVHPKALNRGIKGSFSRVVVTRFEGPFQRSSLKTMKESKVTRSLLMYGTGHVDEITYLPSEDEFVQGKLLVHGGKVSEIGRISMDGNDSQIEFIPNEVSLEANAPGGHYVAEIVAATSSIDKGTVLIDFLGAVKVRHSLDRESIDVVVGNDIEYAADISTKLTEEYIHLSLVYQHTTDKKAIITLWCGQEQLGHAIIVENAPEAKYHSILFGGASQSDKQKKSFIGEIYGVALSRLEGDFVESLLCLAGGPYIEPMNLEPAHQIAIQPNEYPTSLAKKASFVRPLPKQIRWQQYEQTAFIHFGINTYYGVEWGNFNEDPNMFQPTELDTDQWARTLKESGFKLAILTVKHHDGFALYPTRYTKFSVASSTWRDGKGDVLREFVNSMRKYGIKIGIYLSPSDHGAYTDGILANDSPRSERTIPTLVKGDDRAMNSNLPTFKLQATDYGEMLLNQLYEVLTEYGEVDEVWFDGAQGNLPGNREEKYDWDSYYSLINALAPEAVIAITGNDVRWVGNESGYAREDESSVIAVKKMNDGRQAYYPEFDAPDLGSREALASAAKQGMDYVTWWPAEVDVSIRTGWFYHDDQQPKSIEELRDIYYQSIGRNSVLLLNIPPDKRGKFADVDVKRLKEWYQSMKDDFAIDHAIHANISAENGVEGSDPNVLIDDIYDHSWQAASTQPSTITLELEEKVKVDKIVLQEDINHGQQVEVFAIDVYRSSGHWKQIYSSGVIGYKRIVLLDEPVIGSAFRIRILRSRGPVHLSKIGLY